MADNDEGRLTPPNNGIEATVRPSKRYDSNGMAVNCSKVQYIHNPHHPLVVKIIDETLKPLLDRSDDARLSASSFGCKSLVLGRDDMQHEGNITMPTWTISPDTFLEKGQDVPTSTWKLKIQTCTVPQYKATTVSISRRRSEGTKEVETAGSTDSLASTGVTTHNFDSLYDGSVTSKSAVGPISKEDGAGHAELAPEEENNVSATGTGGMGHGECREWAGYMLEMQLHTTDDFAALFPVENSTGENSGTDQERSAVQHSRDYIRVRKAFGRLWYNLLGVLIRKCEWPKFPNSDKKFKDIYQLNEELKSGAYGAVCKGKHRASGKPYAIKIISRSRLSPAEEIDILMEVSVLSCLRNHPNIIHLEDFFEQERYFILIMELCEGGDLFDRIGQKHLYTERDARDLGRLLLEAVRHCHEEEGIAHCDLKPKNLLLQSRDSDALIKLADFGFATRVIFPESLTKSCGTPFFVAPEILKKYPYDQAADMWSLGVIMYCLLGGTMPFLGRTKRQLFSSIVSGHYEFPDQYWSHVSEDAKDLIRGLLISNPRKRMTAREALQSRWITGADGATLAKNDLRSTSHELKTFNARLKLKAAIIGVVSLTQMGFRNHHRTRKATQCTLHDEIHCTECRFLGDSGINVAEL